MTAWKSMEVAPTDRDILLKTSDFGVVQGRWDMQVTNFYKSQEGWASFDPDNAQGDWVSDFYVSTDGERRLFCGFTPHAWMDIPV
ncbi:MAG: hypothetical protein PGN22_02270 [Agrobacterium cavarae]